MPWHAEMKAIKEKMKWVYRPPLPMKPQRCIHHRGRSGKVKHYTEEEIFLYKMRLCASSFNIKTV